MSEDVGEADCLEQCEGTVVDVQRLDGVRDEEGMAKFIRDYERYKYPDWDNLTYPEGMKSKRLFVFIIYIFLYFKTSSSRVISSLYKFLYRPQPLTTSRRWERSDSVYSHYKV